MDLSTILTMAWAQLGNAVDFAEENTLILLPTGFAVVGMSIGLLKRAIHIGGRRR